jgi:hypothetical protein
LSIIDKVILLANESTSAAFADRVALCAESLCHWVCDALKNNPIICCSHHKKV